MLAGMEFEPSRFGGFFAPLVVREEPVPLGPGRPRRDMPPMDVETAFHGFNVRNASMARACLSGILLLHDCLDSSHALSQGIDTPTGSFWHGIMHRREPDNSNAKYWFRRVGHHPVFDELAERAPGIIEGSPAASSVAEVVAEGKWNPFAFVDACHEAMDAGGAPDQLCRQLQQLEWERLFCYSFEQAVEPEDSTD